MPTDEPTRTPARLDADEPLGDPETRRFLVDFVRKRVPVADAEDVVQTVLLDALADEGRPTDRSELRRWLVGIARHKVADVHRRAGRAPVAEPTEQEAGPAPLEARALAVWAEEQAASVRGADETLRWMAREGEGEKLETIAADENIPAARVRQRVSRMRRWMKERWTAELALVAALALLAFVAYELLRAPRELPEAVVPEMPSASPPEPSPLERARQLRVEAFERCEHADWQRCLDGLDRAAELDPKGESEPAVTASRARARAALAVPAPTATPSASAPPVAPTSTVPPVVPRKPSPKTSPAQKMGPKSSMETPFDGASTGDGPSSVAKEHPVQTKERPRSKKPTELQAK